jgi:DNA recombination protein RmuC
MEIFNTIGIALILLLLLYISINLIKKDDSIDEYSKEDLNNPLNQVRSSIETAIGEAAAIISTENMSVKDEVRTLTSIFNSPQEIGSWGERSLEEILKLGGYKKPEDYEVQKSTEVNDETGKRGKPDITLKLYDNKKLIIDSKVPTKNFSYYIKALNEGDKGAPSSTSRNEIIHKHRADAMEDIKRHIDKVAKTEGYIDAKKGTLDFAMMYIPLESVYQFAMTGHFTKSNEKVFLFDYALENNIIVTSPSMILVYLSTIKNAIKKFYIQEKHLELLSLHNDFIAQWDSWDNSFGEIKNSVEKFQDSIESSIKSYSDTRYKKLDKLVEKMKDLVSKKDN